jgi:hypothetical protein
VQLQVAGEHQMLIRGLRPESKSKLVSAFHNLAQSMPCYVRCHATVYSKATIEVLRLEEFLRRAQLWRSTPQGLL